MKISEPIIEIDLHNLTGDNAVEKLTGVINQAPEGTYRIKAIHGFNSGTRIRSGIKAEFRTGCWTRVIRIEPGDNQGVTELVLREY